MRKLIFPGVGVVTLLIVVFAVVLGSNNAAAIQGGGIGGVPANPRNDNPRTKSIFVYKLNQGQQIQDAVKIINNTDETKTLLVYAVDAGIGSGGSFACDQRAEEPLAVGTWVDLAKDKVTLEPNSKQNVKFSLDVPEKAPPGEQNGCIVIQDATSEPVDQGNGIKLSFRSAIRVAVTIPGEITKELDFTGFDVNELDNNKIRMSTSLRNNGNVSLDTNVRTNIKTFFGNLVGSGGGEFPILSESEARFNFELDKVFWGGWYKAQAVAEYNSSPDESIGEGESNKTIYSDEKVIFISPEPLALLIEILALLALFGGAAYAIWRRRYYRNLLANSKSYTVKKGDTINSIAKAHKTNWKLIARVNGLKAPYSLKTGKSLKIPNKKAKTK